MPNTTTLIAIGEMIVNASETLPATTNANIRIMQGEKCGAEILRLIVRDNLGGAANVITNALWVTR